MAIPLPRSRSTLFCSTYSHIPHNPHYDQHHQNAKQVVWFKNNQRIDHSYTTTGARSENTFMFLAQVSHIYVRPEQNKMRSQVGVHFFWLTARNPFFRDKKCCILTFCDNSGQKRPQTQNYTLFSSRTTTTQCTGVKPRTGWSPNLSLLRLSCLSR